MNKNEMRTLLKDLTEQKAPAAQIDLWPAIQAHLPLSQSESSSGTAKKAEPQSRFWWWKPAYLLVAVTIIAAVIFAFPQGRAMGQAVLRFFQQGVSNLMSGVTVKPDKWMEQTPGVSAASITPQPSQPTPPGPAFETTCGSYQDPHCTLKDIRGMVSFPVFALSKLPEAMRFTGATGGPDRVHLVYSTSNQTGTLVIWQEPLEGDGSRQAWEIGADAVIEQVQVGAVSAEYVKGSYDGTTNPPIWNANLDVQVLRWVNQGILIHLQMIGTEPHLGRDDLAALAATMTEGSVGEGASTVAATATPTPADTPFDPRTLYPLTLDQVKEKAGFVPMSPARLPEQLTFIGASYDEMTKIVEIFYKYNDPNNPEATNTLIIREQLAPQGVDCALCGFIQGNGKQVEQYPIGKLVSQDATIETVKIQDVSGQYLEGIGWTSRTECCGWQWDPEPYIKRLRFRTGEVAIEVIAYTYELVKADLLAIAESMK